MVVAVFGLIVLVGIESYKYGSRRYNRRRARKTGWSTIRTDHLGRPLDENGSRITTNHARALEAHREYLKSEKELWRKWREEKLPTYEAAGMSISPSGEGRWEGAPSYSNALQIRPAGLTA